MICEGLDPSVAERCDQDCPSKKRILLIGRYHVAGKPTLAGNIALRSRYAAQMGEDDTETHPKMILYERT